MVLWQAFPWTRIEIFLVVIIIASMLRWPPEKASGIQDLVERHWGDLIGVLLLLLGFGVVLFACLSSTLTPTGIMLIYGLGVQFVSGGLVALKLKTTPGANGNGNGAPVSTVTTHTDTTSDVKTVAPAAGTVVIPPQVVPAQVIKPAQPKVGP